MDQVKIEPDQRFVDQSGRIPGFGVVTVTSVTNREVTFTHHGDWFGRIEGRRMPRSEFEARFAEAPW